MAKSTYSSKRRSAAGALAAAFVLALTAAAPAAHAQLSSDGGPIQYSADTLEYFEAENRLVLSGEVDVLQGDARLRANRLTLFFAPGSNQSGAMGSGDINRMIAEGDVYYLRPTQQARGDRAVYETATDSVTFTGNVVVASDDNVIRGETLTLQVSAGRTTVSSAQTGRRVQGVVNPATRRSSP